jgi:hypothetical protein
LEKKILGAPSNFGEQKVKEQLVSFEDDDLFGWFSIDYLPNVRDIDLLLLHKNAGVFAIEIKAVPISLINTISLNYIDIQGRGKKENPNLQSYNALTSLRDYARVAINTNLPFSVATSCWPLICSGSWKLAFKDEPIIASLADKMIMEEDLSTPNAFTNKLTSIYTNPPIRGGSNRPYNWNIEHKETIDGLCIAKNVAPKIPKQTRFQVLANTHKNNIKKKFPVGTTGKHRFSGVPGSGKTFALMQIAYAYGKEGYQVLFLCFNKVLASQIRAEFVLLSQQDNDPELTDFISVQDVFEHAVTQSYVHGIEGLVSDTHLDWISLLLEELSRNVSSQNEFPTILLVDETQDFKPEFIKWIKFWSQKSTLIAVAEGVGQELYENPQLDGELLNWWNSFEVEELYKNYRNPSFLFKIAFLLASSRLSTTNIQSAFTRLDTSIRNRSLQLVRPNERGIEITPFSDDLNQQQLVSFFTTLIQTKIIELQSQNKNLSELLIIVRGRRAQSIVLDAVNRIKMDELKFDYINYIEVSNRRLTPLENAVRICTFESCRGLESEECIVAGLEILQEDSWNSSSLALVALSRAIKKTTIVINQISGHKLLTLLHQLLDNIELADGD